MKAKDKITAAASRKTSPLRQSTPECRPAQEAEEKAKLKALGRLAATIAHEMRQPLSTIRIIAADLKATVSPTNPRVSKNLKVLEQQAELAGQILSNLVAFARTGKSQPVIVDLDRVLDEVLGRISWRPEIRLKRVVARRQSRVAVDPLHLDRILSNLIANGLESMEGEGTLSISTRSERSEIVLRIADSGCGIHPAQAENIFEAFVTTKSNGTGLGLALSRQLAEANGGSIGFKSRPGKGSTFELRLPRS